MTATLIKVRAARAKIREQFPISYSTARHRLNLRPREFAVYARFCPPDYSSRGGRVRRYRAPMKPEPYGIYGTNANDLRVSPVCYNKGEPRAAGSFQDMHTIVKQAVREWPSLTFHREVEEIAARFSLGVAPAPQITQTQKQPELI